MSKALRELRSMAKAIYIRELDRARKEWPIAIHLEHVDPRYNEADQAYKLVLKLEQEADDKLIAEVARLGT